VTDAPDVDRRLLWLMQVGQRPWRELYWLSLMPRTAVTAVGSPKPPESVTWVESTYRQPTDRFIEAGALAWLRDLDRVQLTEASGRPAFDWVTALEPFSLVTGQAADLAGSGRAQLAVLMWHNFAGTPLYRLPPYRFAWHKARDADFFLCIIEAARQHIIEMGVDPARTATVHPGIDVQQFVPPEQPAEDPVIAFVSPLRPSKGIDRVLEAFALVRRSVPEARLVIGGTGEEEPLVRRAALADPQHVQYLGGLAPDRVRTVLQQASMFVTAPRPTRTWNEQFGLAYTEAMACGLPVVTTACGTNYEAVPDPNPRLPDDAEALAAAMVDLLQDRAKRLALGAFNREYVVEHHDVVTQAVRMGEAFAAAEARLS
jgi:phosphatidyl-myo-inositol dimannoside synthase